MAKKKYIARTSDPYTGKRIKLVRSSKRALERDLARIRKRKLELARQKSMSEILREGVTLAKAAEAYGAQPTLSASSRANVRWFLVQARDIADRSLERLDPSAAARWTESPQAKSLRPRTVRQSC